MNKAIRKHYLQLTDDNKALFEETEEFKKEVLEFYEQVKAILVKMENKFNTYQQIIKKDEKTIIDVSEMENNIREGITAYNTFANGLIPFMKQAIEVKNKIESYIKVIGEGGTKMVNGNLTNKHCEKILEKLETGMKLLKSDFEQSKKEFASKKVLLKEICASYDKTLN